MGLSWFEHKKESWEAYWYLREDEGDVLSKDEGSYKLGEYSGGCGIYYD